MQLARGAVAAGSPAHAGIDLRPNMRNIVQQEFSKGNAIPVTCFPSDSAAVTDSRRLTAVAIDPQTEWDTEGTTRKSIREWTRMRGTSARLYPGALVWAVKKPGRELRDSVAEMLAWRRVARDVDEGLLGSEFSDANRNEVQSRLKEAEQNVREEVWASYRFITLLDNQSEGGLKVIDLGLGHAGNGTSLAGRIVAALKSEALVSDGISVGYIGRNWPPAFQDSGAWPLSSLRQSFLDGSLTRLPDPDTALREKITEFVKTGDFGLASGEKASGGYERIWHSESVPAEEVAFESGVFLLTKAKAEELCQAPTIAPPGPVADDDGGGDPDHEEPPQPQPPQDDLVPVPERQKARVSITGTIPRESWNQVGTRLMPKLQVGEEINARVELSAIVGAEQAQSIAVELRQALEDLGLNLQLDVSEA